MICLSSQSGEGCFSGFCWPIPRKNKILWGNVFPNSLLPLITMLGLSIGSLLGGTSVVEVIFSYPGLGNLAVQAITSYDYYLIQGYVLWVATGARTSPS